MRKDRAISTLKTTFSPKIQNVYLWVCRIHFSVKNFWTMKKFNKSYAWTPSISNLALLFFFCKIWPSKVWKCNETKMLDFYQFLRFWVKTSLKSYGSFFNVYWRRMRCSNLIQKIKFEKIALPFLYIKLLRSILSLTVWQNQAVSIPWHYTMVHHNME